jgi:uncharacterized protein YbjT (DUF2867 family)
MAAPIFMTGATGYIGGRLAPRLLAGGESVRSFVRSPRKLDEREWTRWPRSTVIQGDIADTASLADAMRGCSTAYYLVHSMIAAGDEYAERDKALARSFATAARQAGINRIIYLGGLGEDEDALSKHLKSRRDVEAMLRSAGVPVIVLRAAVILGSGSASFEILRYLVERLPVMITPKWVRTPCQPIAVRDVLHYLLAARHLDADSQHDINRTIEIGGPEVVTYRELIDITAEELGVPKRLVIPVPVLTPTLSARWIDLITPLPASIARPLSDGLRNRVVVNDHSAETLMPHKPIGVREAVRRAVGKTADHDIETRWSAAGAIPGDPDWAGGTTFKDERTIDVQATPDGVFAAVCKVGGGHGWYAANALWKIRGLMDWVVGGPGLRRGRRDPVNVQFGEALDFWRVVGVQRPTLLALRAEMKLPGTAQLEFRIDPTPRDVHPDAADAARLTMTARFIPRGLLGLAYWYAVLPFHHFVFTGMLNGIRRAAETDADDAQNDGA